MTEQSAHAHVPQCPECGLPMSIASIVPAFTADWGRTADNYVYECVQGHELIKRVESKARSRIRNHHTAALERKTALMRLLPNRTRRDDYLIMSASVASISGPQFTGGWNGYGPLTDRTLNGWPSNLPARRRHLNRQSAS